MDTDLRNLIVQADSAMLTMLKQVNILLEAAQVYAARNPAIGADVWTIPKTDKMKHRELNSAVFDLSSIPKMLVGEIFRWKKNEKRVLSRMNTETFLLNELYANMESMLWFYTREGIDLPGFSLDLVKASHSELLRCNRLL